MRKSLLFKATLASFCVSIVLSGCSSTDSFSLVSKHPKALSGDVIPALMRTAKARCAAEGGTIQFHEFSQTEYDDRNMRSSLLYSCLNTKKELAVNDDSGSVKKENPSPVRDLARGRSFESEEYEDTVARLSYKSDAVQNRRTEEQNTVQLHPDPLVPMSAEWETYSDYEGEPAGVVPTPEQLAFLNQKPNLEEQTNSDANNYVERKPKASFKKQRKLVAKSENNLSKTARVETQRKTLISASQIPEKSAKPVKKAVSPAKTDTFEAEVDALKAKAKSIHKERASKPIQRATPKPVLKAPVVVQKQIEVKPVSIKAKPLEKAEEKLESAGYAGRPITEEVW